jgi:8-oxo-dGTP pyrophosphatase MutT (NUDIX family)
VKAIIERNGTFLLLRRNVPHESWDLPGGLVEEGETDRDALTREVAEEIGVVIDRWTESGTWSFFRPLDGQRVHARNYAAPFPAEEIALSEEHLAHAWITVAEIRRYSVKDPSLYDALERHFSSHAHASSSRP